MIYPSYIHSKLIIIFRCFHLQIFFRVTSLTQGQSSDYPGASEMTLEDVYNIHLWQRPTKHDDAIKWKHFPRYWPFVQGIHRSSVNLQRPVTRSFNVFFEPRLNKRLSKSWGWWFDTKSRLLWRIWFGISISSFVRIDLQPPSCVVARLYMTPGSKTWSISTVPRPCRQDLTNWKEIGKYLAESINILWLHSVEICLRCSIFCRFCNAVSCMSTHTWVIFFFLWISQ